MSSVHAAGPLVAPPQRSEAAGGGGPTATGKSKLPRSRFATAALVLLPLVLLLLLLGVVYSLIRATNSTRWERRTDGVRMELLRLQSDLVDAESGQRGYLATGDPAFLEPYARETNGWRALLDEVRRSTFDDPDRQRQLDELQPFVERKLDLLRAGVDARRHGAAGAELVPLVSAGKDVMDDIRARLTQMQRAEELLDRERAATATRFSTLAIAGLFSAALLLLAGGPWLLLARHAEQDVGRANERFRGIFDQAAVGMAEVALEGRWIRVNDRLCEIVGYRCEELEQRTYQEITHPDDRERDQAIVQELLSGARTTSTLEKRYLRKDGTPVWVRLAVSVVRTPSGSPDYFIAVVEDIDDAKTIALERARFEEQVRQSAERFEALFAQSRVAKVVLAPDRSIVECNDAFAKLLDYACSDMIGRNIDDVTHPDDRAENASEMDALLSTGGPIARRKRYIASSGRIVHADVNATPLYDGRGGAVLKEMVDITDQVAAEREREVLLEREQSARQDAERAAKLAELFVAVLGHDLRNPLSAILTGGALIARTDDERTRGTAMRITSSAQRMARMIEQILDFSRIRSGQGLPKKPAAMDLREVLTRVVQELTTTKGDERVHIEIDGDTRGCWDDDRLGQVFSNLVANALEHSPDGSVVRVSVDGRDASRVAIAVQNPGTIPVELVGEIFDPFRKARQHAKSRGLGLGLYITKQIVEAHGGTIDVTTSDDAGTCFHVVLPR